MRLPKSEFHVLHLALTLVLCTGLAACQSTPTGPRPLPNSTAIEAEATRLMASADVKGLALAVIDNGQVVHVSAHGLRNVEHNLPLQTDTVMYGASLTKAVVAYYVMQLVDEKRVGLDTPFATAMAKPLTDYEDYADLKTDQRCLVMLANSVNAERIYPALTAFVLGETGMPWWWEYGEQ